MEIKSNLPINSSLGGVNSATDNPSQARRVSEENVQVEREARRQRFDVDQQALAVVEQEDRRGRQQQQNATGYDQPNQQNQTAVAAYESISNLDNRQSIQQLFGIDLTV